ncbi:MAG: YaaA family protein [Muribaculaceae bacterium]|nr:YaaA family protein [Muribaculaceae bacterium]
MITLIAESKTMDDREVTVSPETYEHHKPSGEAGAGEIMQRVAAMSAPEIACLIKISIPMAAKVARMAYEFPNKLTGILAIESFTGVVFRAFDYHGLSPEEKDRAGRNVRIISSLYGWLRPDDIIKPYRFDFNTDIAPDDKALSAFWRKDVTIELVKCLQAQGEKSILNLLPADASKCIDWKLVKRFAKVWKVDFKEPKDGSGWRTPHAGRLKTLRGELLRCIITQDISDPSMLLTLTTDNMIPLATPDYPDHIAFCV